MHGSHPTALSPQRLSLAHGHESTSCTSCTAARLDAGTGKGSFIPHPWNRRFPDLPSRVQVGCHSDYSMTLSRTRSLASIPRLWLMAYG